MRIRRIARAVLKEVRRRDIDFAAVNWKDQKNWSHAYSSGLHRDVWDSSHVAPELAGLIATGIVPANAIVLDVGCGSGQDAVYLAMTHNFQVHGLDFCSEAIGLASERSRQMGAKVSWHVGSALELPFENDKFDLICDSGCFHYLSEDQRRVYAGGIARTLKVGGILFIRGCGIDVRPFNPITQKALELAFDGRRFKINPLMPFFLATDSGGMDAVMTTIWRTR